ncbi:hypothetical protein BH18CHL2_BH18CHL2_08800 [soil metagenome]
MLTAMSRAPLDLQRVFDAVVENAVRLCRAESGFVFQVREGLLTVRAFCGASAGFARGSSFAVDDHSVVGRAAISGAVVQVADVLAEPSAGPETRAAQEAEGSRAVLAVPLLREGQVTGVVSLGRNAVRPFSSEEVQLAQTFADQAAIAMENSRLYVEAAEAGER